MKNLVKLAGIFALVATIGFSFTSCNSITWIEEDYDLDGTTWINSITLGRFTIDTVYEFYNQDYIITHYIGGVIISGKGTYYVSGNTVNLSNTSFFFPGSRVTFVTASDATTGKIVEDKLTIDGHLYTKQ